MISARHWLNRDQEGVNRIVGARKRRNRKCFDAVVQKLVHVPTRLCESFARSEKRQNYYKYLAWLYPIGRRFTRRAFVPCGR